MKATQLEAQGEGTHRAVVPGPDLALEPQEGVPLLTLLHSIVRR